MSDNTSAVQPKTGGFKWLNLILGIVFVVLGSSVLKDTAVRLAELELHIGKILAMVGITLILFPLIDTFYIKPLRDAINERNTNLETTFAEAESLKARMTELKSSYEEKLAKAEADAREEIQKAINEAQAIRAQILDEAKGQADDVRRRAEEDMQRERDKMMVDLRSHVADLALTATERIIGASMDEQKQRELVNRFIETAEVGR